MCHRSDRCGHDSRLKRRVLAGHISTIAYDFILRCPGYGYGYGQGS